MSSYVKVKKTLWSIWQNRLMSKGYILIVMDVIHCLVSSFIFFDATLGLVFLFVPPLWYNVVEILVHFIQVLELISWVQTIPARKLSKKSALLTVFGDIIALIPIPLVLMAISYFIYGRSGMGTSGLFLAARIFKLLKLARLLKVSWLFVEPMLIMRGRKKSAALFCKFVYVGSLSVHAASCIWIALRPDEAHIEQRSRYILSLYWTISTLSTVGYGDIGVDTNYQRVFSVILMLIGVGIYGFVIGKFSVVLLKNDSINNAQKEDVSHLMSLMNFYCIPQDTQQEIVQLYSYVQEQNTIEKYSDVISRLPETMEKEVRLYARIKMIHGFPLFKKVSMECLKSLAQVLKPEYVDPRSVVFDHGSIGDSMYFVVYGNFEVILPNGKHIANITKGFFGEISLFFNVKRTATIRAVTYCNILRLSKSDFVNIMSKFNELSIHVRRLVRQKLTEMPNLYRDLKDISMIDDFHDSASLDDQAFFKKELDLFFPKEGDWMRIVLEQNALYNRYTIQQQLIKVFTEKKDFADRAEKGNDVIVQVTIRQAKELAAMDIGGFSDPYCLVRCDNVLKKTKIKKATLCPQWNESFTFIGSHSSTLRVTTFDFNFIGSDSFLGEVQIKLEDLIFGEKELKWYDLTDAPPLLAKYKQGKLQIEVLKSSLHQEDVERYKSHLIEVSLLKARNLLSVDIGGASDPFIELDISGRVIWKSAVKMSNLNPIWNERFFVAASNTDVLHFTCYDFNYIGKADFLGEISIPVSDINTEEISKKWYALENISKGEVELELRKLTFLQANLRALNLTLQVPQLIQLSSQFANRCKELLNEDWDNNYKITYEVYLQKSETEYQLQNYDKSIRYVTMCQQHAKSDIDMKKTCSQLVKIYCSLGDYQNAMSHLKQIMSSFLPMDDQGLQEYVNSHNKRMKPYYQVYKLRKLKESCEDPLLVIIHQALRNAIPCLMGNSHFQMVIKASNLWIAEKLFHEGKGLSDFLNVCYLVSTQLRVSKDVGHFQDIFNISTWELTRGKKLPKSHDAVPFAGYYYASFMPFANCTAGNQYEVLRKCFDDGVSAREMIITPFTGIMALFSSLHCTNDLMKEDGFLEIYGKLEKYIKEMNNPTLTKVTYYIYELHRSLTSTIDLELSLEDPVDSAFCKYMYHFVCAILKFMEGNYQQAYISIVEADQLSDMFYPTPLFFYQMIWFSLILCHHSLELYQSKNKLGHIESDEKFKIVQNIQGNIKTLKLLSVGASRIIHPCLLYCEAEYMQVSNEYSVKDVIVQFRSCIDELQRGDAVLLDSLVTERLASFIEKQNFGMEFSKVIVLSTHQKWSKLKARTCINRLYAHYEDILIALEAEKLLEKSDDDDCDSQQSEQMVGLYRNLFSLEELKNYTSIFGASRMIFTCENSFTHSQEVVVDVRASGKSDAEGEQKHLRIDESMRKVYEVMYSRKKPLIIPDISKSNSFQFDISLIQRGVHSLLGYPLFREWEKKTRCCGMLYAEFENELSEEKQSMFNLCIENLILSHHYRIEKKFLMHYLPPKILNRLHDKERKSRTHPSEFFEDYCPVCEVSAEYLSKDYQERINSMLKGEMAILLPDLTNEKLFQGEKLSDLKRKLIEKERLIERQNLLIHELTKNSESPITILNSSRTTNSSTRTPTFEGFNYELDDVNLDISKANDTILGLKNSGKKSSMNKF